MNRYRLRTSAPWVLMLLFVIAAPAGLAQQPTQQPDQSVVIGGTTLRLGQPRQQAMGEARARFNVSSTDRAGEYFLYPKVSPMGRNGQASPPGAVGSITIANGRLARVTRNLGSFRSADGQAAIQNMIRAFAQAPNEEDSVPVVHTDTSMSGDASTTRVYFSYPDRVIQVVVFQPADTSIKATVDITEQYALRKNDEPATTMGNR